MLSADPQNTVIGLVRENRTATEAKVSEELKGRTNVHILVGDLRSYTSLQVSRRLIAVSVDSRVLTASFQIAAAETAKITGGSLDYLIANAGLMSLVERFVPIGVLYVASSLFPGSLCQV